MKAHRVDASRIAVHCPGCGRAHVIDTPRWVFNGDYERPTFQPSVNVSLDAEDGIPAYRCHSFITDGRIQFLGDCTHALAGQTVELPEWEDV